MADQKKLARAVNVDGEWYQPGGDDLPPEVAEKITNPKAWMTDQDIQAAEVNEDGTERKAGTASGAKLRATVYVAGRAYGPDDHVPDDVAAQIKNPKAWEGDQLPGQAKAKDDRTGGAAAAEDANTPDAKARKAATPTKRV